MKKNVERKAGGKAIRASQGQKGSLTPPRLSWRCLFSDVGGKQIKRCDSANGGKRETGNRNSGILATQLVHLYSGNPFSSRMTTLKPLSSHLVLSPEGFGVGWRSCVAGAPSLIFKEKGPSSSLKCTSELE